ncbi:MAG TPA: glycosyltransferase family 1 protein [Acidimicrobiales bacterium]
MNIAVMGRSLRGQMSGVVRYTHELVSAFARVAPDNITVFVTRAPDGLDDLPVRRIRAPFATRSEYSRAAWEQLIVPVEVSRLGPDVYHSPNYIVPLALRCPVVVTVHDTFFLDRRLQRLKSHLYLRTLTALAVRKADRIICVSRHTLDAFTEHFPHARTRACLVGEGVSPMFTPSAVPDVQRFRDTHGIPERYILFVGTFEPRKNLARLVAAYEQAMHLTDAPDHLVMCGGAGWMNTEMYERIERSPLRGRIHVLGYLADDHLPVAYSGCSLFVYPSLAEGFGLPPLEAMACGAPVVTSNTTSLPEAVGEAARLVDPFDVESIADGMVELLSDEIVRKTYVEAGFARAGAMSWDAVATRTLAVYKDIA